MKKILIGIGIALIVLILLVVVGSHFFLDSAIKRGVEVVGPKLTKVNVKLDSVKVSLLSGSGEIKGLVVGNPEGYKTPEAIKVGSAALALKPGSVLSDKIIINKIEVIAPEITFEGGLKGNNLDKILANVEEATRGGTNAPATPEEQKAASKKLQVDDFVIKGARVQITLTDLGYSTNFSLPEFHVTNLGQGPEGITTAELTHRILKEVEGQVVQAASVFVNNIGKSAAVGIGKEMGKSALTNFNVKLPSILQHSTTNTAGTNTHR